MNRTRRTILKAAAAGTTATLLPSVATAAFNRRETIVGEGDYQYRVSDQFLQLPEKYSWQTTHNVAVDSENNIYVIHEGRRNLKDHPSIFVFGPDGKFIRAYGSQFQGGGHGIEVRKEGSQEFLYVAAYQQVKAFAKLTLTGETVWFRKAPMESGVYDKGEDISTETNWSRKGFLPTNFAFLNDGGFLLADGYGSYHIHRFDKDANWVSSFGGQGEGKGTFNTAHGLWIDDRPGRDKSIVVTDRAHHTLQRFDMSGQYIETLTGFGLPANIDVRGDLMLVSELHARLTLLDKSDKVVARLGNEIEQATATENLRGKPNLWKTGQFIHPHDACFDLDGNILVTEWVATGRVSRLTRLS